MSFLMMRVAFDETLALTIYRFLKEEGLSLFEALGVFFVAMESLPLLYKFDILRMETLHNEALHKKIETEGKIFFIKTNK